MVRLRELGFTNLEVSRLTNGGWSEPSVKVYTRGVTVKDPAQKERAIGLLVELVERGLSLEQVEQAISVMRVLEAGSLSLEEVSRFLSEMKRLKVEIREVIGFKKEVEAAGLTMPRLKEILAYKSGLEERGFSIESLGSISEIAEKYGGVEDVLEALKTYGELKELKDSVSQLESKKAELDKTINDLKHTVSELEKKKGEIENALKKHRELVDKGFSEEVLDELKEASNRYGGVKQVLEALRAYDSLKEIEKSINELEAEEKNIETAIEKKNVEYAHLQTVIKMCDSLIFKYKFSMPDVSELIELAKTYGNPADVLKAIVKYGELKKIEGEAAELSKRKVELEARIRELETQIQELRGVAEELKSSAKGLLKPLAEEIERGVKTMEQKFIEAIDKISTSYEEYSRKFGELKSEAGRLEEELRLARIVSTMTKYPSEAKDMSLDYALLLQDAVAKLCSAKGVNPKVEAGDELQSKYYFIPSQLGVELLDIIDWSRRGLLIAIRQEGESKEG